MKYVKDFKAILKDLEPFVRKLKPLHSGRPLENFSLRPREIWTLWLLCVALHKMHHPNITFADDTESDGILIDIDAHETIMTENVCALNTPSKKKLPKGEARVIQAIESKIKKGPDYAKGKILTVFFDGAEIWFRNKVREAIRGKHNFERIYLIGLLTDKKGTEYSYTVTELYDDYSRTCKVQISPDFTDWTVSVIQ
ncbi:MAG: hypothetical protein PHS73_03785 [Candidatus Peribacteraceae bacterium]|nr:hypothetical protein [Candidatus Peribacteraceae bacterium]